MYLLVLDGLIGDKRQASNFKQVLGPEEPIWWDSCQGCAGEELDAQALVA